MPETPDLRTRLAAPFAEDEVEFLPGAVTKDKSKALALAYVDARCVMDRLDDVCGVDGWQDAYHDGPEGTVVCTLSLRFGDVWLSKQDVGCESEQAEPGNRRKAAFSDALKRAAVKWGVGRYLYSLPARWHPYDADRKCFVDKPRLPGAKPPAKPAPAAAAKPPQSGTKLPLDKLTAQQKRDLTVWENRLDNEVSELRDMNDALALYAQMPDGPAKPWFRDALQNCARNHGWHYDRSAGRFAVGEPQPV